MMAYCFFGWLIKETLKTLDSFRGIPNALKTPEYAETENQTNQVHWNGVAKSYLLWSYVTVP